MLLSAQPTKVQVPFANAGTKNTIPVPSQIGVTPGAASFNDGFPPLTFTPINAGGVPPAGADFNGVLYAITLIQRWQCGGGLFTYDSGWSTANGGYAKGALLLKSDGSGYWRNLADGNTTDPDGGSPSNWSSFDINFASNATTQAGLATSQIVTPAGLAAAAIGGSWQSVQDVTASRDITGSTFTNGTGRLICCMVTIELTAASGAGAGLYSVLINGSTVGWHTVGDLNGSAAGVESKMLTFFVPPGATYRVAYNSGATCTLQKWTEIR